MMRTIGTIALCAAFLACSSPAAQAARPPKGKLKIVIAVKNGPARGATLNCNPDSGTHPHPRQACDVVRKVGGDLDKIHVPADSDCGQEIKPYAVMITGTWRGEKVQWSKGYRNFCAMQSAAGKLLS